MNTSQSMRGRYALVGMLMVTMAIGICQTSFGQSVEIIHVNIEREWPSQEPEDGESWLTAYRFLQDGLSKADQFLNLPEPPDDVEIWVAKGTYRPDQSKVNDDGPNDPPGDCPPYGDCDRSASFHLRDNVTIYGGFSGDGWETLEGDRNWETNITILSGDLLGNDDFVVNRVTDPPAELSLEFNNYEYNSQHVVVADSVGRSAVLDGFVIRGGIDIRGAQPLFRDCVITLHEGAAVRCDDNAHAIFHRCTFANLLCDSIIIAGASRLELLACEPAAVLDEAHTCGRASVASCSQLLAVHRERLDAMMREWEQAQRK